MSESLISRYRAVVERLHQACARVGRLPAEVTLIAVSKTQSADAIEMLYREGHRDFGENYVQELVTKAAELEQRGCTEIRWHFIGHLQTNKVKQVLPWVTCIHSVDSVKLAREISKRWKAQEQGDSLSVLLEVNLDREASKSGIAPEELAEVGRQVRDLEGLSCDGLMCIPKAERHSGETSPFQRLQSLAAQLGLGPELSMGMTQDFEEAIAHGSTLIRVGTAIFGERVRRAE